MSDDNKDNDNSELSDDALWRMVTKDVKKLPGKTYREAEKSSKKQNKQPEQIMSERIIIPSPPKQPQKAPQGQDLDRRTEDRLRKGQIRPEATLDMHGMSQDEAYEAVIRFIHTCHAQGKRCVLIVTGKGRGNAPVSDSDIFAPQPGVLKRRTPEWLGAEAMRPYILKFMPARQKDGGDGALYVYLRRQR